MEGDIVSHFALNVNTFYFNPRLPCGRRPFSLSLRPIDRRISIHAFRVEGDRWSVAHFTQKVDFNPRLPCGRRLVYSPDNLRHQEFQSTPSVWKATVTVAPQSQQSANFNPRLPCGRRQTLRVFHGLPWGFQSTPSVWKATTSFAQ